MRRFHIIRCAAAALLAFCGGCLLVPTPYHTLDDAPNIKDAVGDAHSNRPLRTGMSTKSDVRARLGEPLGQSADGRIYVYGQALSGGVGVAAFPYPAAGALTQRTEFLRLEFDSNDVLRKFRIEYGDPRGAGMGYSEYDKPDNPPWDLLQP